jgi:hypothetical protein
MASQIPFWSNSPRGFEGPIYAENPHDSLIIAGMPVPGIVDIKAIPAQDYKTEKAPGRDGGIIIGQGYLPGPIDVEILLWMPEQWEAWLKIEAEIWPAPGKISAGSPTKGASGAIERGGAIASERALSISHPALLAKNISRVVVAGISLPQRGPQPQSRIVNMKLLEFVPPAEKKASRKIDGTAAKTSAEPPKAFQYENQPASPAARGEGGPEPTRAGATGGAG